MTGGKGGGGGDGGCVGDCDGVVGVMVGLLVVASQSGTLIKSKLHPHVQS